MAFKPSNTKIPRLKRARFIAQSLQSLCGNTILLRRSSAVVTNRARPRRASRYRDVQRLRASFHHCAGGPSKSFQYVRASREFDGYRENVAQLRPGFLFQWLAVVL